MTLKNRSIIEVEFNGRQYDFVCACESPLAEAVQAHSMVGDYLQARIKALQDTNEAKDIQEAEVIVE